MLTWGENVDINSVPKALRCIMRTTSRVHFERRTLLPPAVGLQKGGRKRDAKFDVHPAGAFFAGGWAAKPRLPL